MPHPRRPLSRPTRLAAACAAVLAAAAAASPLAAQSGRPLFAWNGRVDREVTLVMRGGSVDTRSADRGDEGRGRVRVGAALPRTDGAVDVRVYRGRGSAEVLQQPSARNDYTAVVRLRDDQPGTGDYQIATLWRPLDGGYAGDGRDDDRGDRGDRRRGNGRGGWGRDDDRDSRDHRDGQDDRDARDDRDDRDGQWERGDRDRGDRGDRADRSERRNNGRGWGWGRGGRPGRGRDDENRGRDGRVERDGRDRRDDGTPDDRARGRGGWGGVLGLPGRDGGSAGALRWSGRVDDVQEVRIRGRRASTVTVSGGGASDVRTSVSGGGLPARDVTVRLRNFDGRGRVYVAEQPSARNDYTAVLRIEDRQGGAGFYDVEASWN